MTPPGPATPDPSIAVWLPTLGSKADARCRVVCLGGVGVGSMPFLQWRRFLPETIEAVPVRLPGRETRISEPPIAHLSRLVTSLMPAIAAIAERPYLLLGHCSGALIAFEVARAIARTTTPGPALLCVLSQAAPSVTAGGSDQDRSVWERLGDLVDIPDEVLADRKLQSFVEPTLRADFAILDGYEYTPGPPLQAPIEVLLGRADRMVARRAVLPWGLETEGRFGLHVHDGDHQLPRHADHVLFHLLDRWAGMLAR